MKLRRRDCLTCGEIKDGSEFYPYTQQCKQCMKEKRKLRIASDPEKHKKQNITNCAKYRARLIKRNTAQ
jgi:hypothetical protein